MQGEIHIFLEVRTANMENHVCVGKASMAYNCYTGVQLPRMTTSIFSAFNTNGGYKVDLET